MKYKYFIVGASGSGKSTIVKEYCKKFGTTSVDSFTSREPRWVNEEGHKFVDENKIINMIKNKEIIGWDIYDNNYYGATEKQIRENDFYVTTVSGIKGVERNNLICNKDKIDYRVFWILADKNRLEEVIYQRKIDMKNITYNEQSRYLLDDYNYSLNSFYENYIVYNVGTIEEAVEDIHRIIKSLEE